MLQPPARPQQEFGKRQIRPAVRRVEPPRPLPSFGKRAPGAALRSFVAPGATVHVPKNSPNAGKRLAVALAVATGVLVGAAIAPHAISQVMGVSAAASHATTQFVIKPAAELAADASAAFGREASRAAIVMAEAQVQDAEAMRQAIADAPVVAATAVRSVGSALAGAVENTVSNARDAMDASGRTIMTAAHDAYDGAKARTAAWVDDQISEGIASAKLMKRELSPAMAALTQVADRAANQIMDDMDRSERIEQMERTGMVVDASTLPATGEIDARIAADSQALARANERKVASIEPARVDLSDISPSAGKPHKGFGPANAYAYAGYEVSGNSVKIGGEKIDAHVVSSISRAAKATGNDPVYLASLASRESNFRASLPAKTSSADGLFQFLQQTWFHVLKTFGGQFGYEEAAKEIKVSPRGYVVADPSKRSKILAMRGDPLASATMAGAMEKSDRAVIEKALGRAPTAGERYMTHFFGVSEAARFLSLAKQWPNGPAADYFYKAAMANKTLFWKKGGEKKTFTEVAAGFKDWFEGPNGGMRRFQAFEEAAAEVAILPPPQTVAAHETVRPSAQPLQRPDRQAVAAAKHRSVTPGKVKLVAGAAPAKAPAAASSNAEAAPVQVAALEAAPEAAKSNATVETVVYETQYVRTPVVPGKPASYQLGSGRIVGYIDARGRLSSTATSFARSQIIEGFGSAFNRLPPQIQEHLKNAAQLDLNLLAPYARVMPKTMRDGFAEEGLTFIDAVAQTGGKLVAVKVPKRVEVPVEANVATPAPIAAAQPPQADALATEEVEPSVDEDAHPPVIVQAALTTARPDVDRSMFADVPMPKIPPIPPGLQSASDFVPKDIAAEMAKLPKPDLTPFPEITSASSSEPAKKQVRHERRPDPKPDHPTVAHDVAAARHDDEPEAPRFGF